MKTQRIFFSKLCNKRNITHELNMNSITGNKEFGTTIKPFLSDKVTAQTKISLAEKSKLLLNKTKVTETFSNSFENAVNQLGINRDDAKFNDEPVLSANPVNIAI